MICSPGRKPEPDSESPGSNARIAPSTPAERRMSVRVMTPPVDTCARASGIPIPPPDAAAGHVVIVPVVSQVTGSTGTAPGTPVMISM
jgi:hypothetical protein